MTISSTNNGTRPRQKRAKLKGDKTMEVEKNQGQSLKTDSESKLAKNPAKEESANNTLAISGVRPIASSDLEVAETVSISGLRPITSSNLQVVEQYNAMGIRPIGANTMHVVGTMNLSGVRPIASSALAVSQTYSVMGNRPVASNEIDDAQNLMGFLD